MNSRELLFNGETVTVSYEKTGDGFKVVAGGREFLFSPAGENCFHAYVNGRLHHAAVVHDKGVYYIDIDSVLLEVREPSDDDFAGGGAADHAGEKDKIYAPMPGKIVKIMVNAGDEVEVKQPLVIVEAMKMENQVNSKARGKVRAVNFSAGDQVDTETPIIELELHE